LLKKRPQKGAVNILYVSKLNLERD
jgi:hypothetical protein